MEGQFNLMAKVRRFVFNEISDVPVIGSSALALPNTLSMQTGIYVFNGVKYDCSVPGLYLFWAENPASPVIISRIAYGPDYRIISDIYSFMSAINWHHLHAQNDEGMTGQVLSDAARTHKLRLRCGYVVDWLIWWLGAWGWTVRKIQLLTQEPSNGVNDGHLALEIFHEGKWKLWDISNGFHFVDNGIHLSAAEIIAIGPLNCERVKDCASPKVGSAVLTNPDGTFWCFASSNDLISDDEWVARIYQTWAVV